MNYKNLCLKVCSLAKDVGKFIKKESNKFDSSNVKYKGYNSLVSYVDIESEKRLVSALRKLLPEAGFITEEKTINKVGKHFNWIVDPLDGTTNFTHSVPTYAISVALIRDTEVVLGVVYEINRDECFYAWSDSNSFLNNKIIEVSKTGMLIKSLIATGFPYYDFGRMKEYVNVFNYFMRKTQGMRRLGSAAVDLAYVACGRFDGFYEYGLNSWDVAAGAFIIKQAGGKVTDFSGKENFIFGKEIVASNKIIYKNFLSVISHEFCK